MDGASTAEAILGQRLPLAAGAQSVDDGLQHQLSRAGFAGRPAPGLRT